MVTTDYINTIPPDEEPWFQGNEENRVADPGRDPLEHDGDGRPARTTASTPWAVTLSTLRVAASLYEVGFNHFFRGKADGGFGDQVFMQGHAAPGIYARAFLEGRLTDDHLDRFRREVFGGGLPSYPHPRGTCPTSGSTRPSRWASARSTRSTRPGSTATCCTGRSSGTGTTAHV